MRWALGHFVTLYLFTKQRCGVRGSTMYTNVGLIYGKLALSVTQPLQMVGRDDNVMARHQSYRTTTQSNLTCLRASGCIYCISINKGAIERVFASLSQGTVVWVVCDVTH